MYGLDSYSGASWQVPSAPYILTLLKDFPLKSFSFPKQIVTGITILKNFNSPLHFQNRVTLTWITNLMYIKVVDLNLYLVKAHQSYQESMVDKLWTIYSIWPIGYT